MASIEAGQSRTPVAGGPTLAGDALTPLISLHDLVVEFGAQRALDRVSINIHPGEITGLVGANGAGKSTLGRVLVGEIPFGAYQGSIRLRGNEVRFADSREAHDAGIVLVHQEGAAIDQLTIGENVMLTIEPTRRGFIDWPALHGRAAAALGELGVEADTHKLLGEHGGVALMELVEIARSIVRGGQVYVFDESTAALGADEVTTLLARMREISAKGAAIIFISHHIDEILSVCDRVIVLRDGRKVLDAARDSQDHASVIEAMLGRRLVADKTVSAAKEAEKQSTDAVLRLSNWQTERSELSRVAVGPVNFTLRKGEVFGIFGPLGAGKTELLHSLYGLGDQVASGECWLKGQRQSPFSSPGEAIAQGFALVTAERQKEGVVPELSVLDNIMLGYHRTDLSWRRLFVRHDQTRALCEKLIGDLGIKTDGPDQPVKALSGGNQQKVLLARALINQPQILLLDEPTRGIDVGAKQDVYRWIRHTAAAGTVVIVSSLEEAELIGLADRILVLRDGRQVAIVEGRDATEHRLLALASGAKLN
jgi:ABC-type sugar transport system ATPase subunit